MISSLSGQPCTILAGAPQVARQNRPKTLKGPAVQQVEQQTKHDNNNNDNEKEFLHHNNSNENKKQ